MSVRAFHAVLDRPHRWAWCGWAYVCERCGRVVLATAGDVTACTRRLP